MNAWQAKSPELAALAFNLLVNNPLRWLQYMELAKRGLVLADGRKLPEKTFAAPSAALIGKLILDERILRRHFAATNETALIGLYAISAENTCRWVVIDIDAHGDGCEPGVNREAAVYFFDKLVSIGFAPLLIESGPDGGFHIWIVFSEPIPSPIAHFFGKWLVADYAITGLKEVPETFPKQPALTPTVQYGNGARLPGRHHTRAYWPKAYDGISWVGEYGAVAEVLALKLSDPALIPVEAAPPPPKPAPRPVRIDHTATDRRLKIALSYVSKMPAAIANQRGHDKLLAAASRCWKAGLNKDEAMIVLRNFNRRCQPEWTDSELERKYDEAAKLNGAAVFGEMLNIRDSHAATPLPRRRSYFVTVGAA